MMDFDNKRLQFEDIEMNSFIVLQTFGCIIILITIPHVIKSNILNNLFIAITALILLYGICILNNQDDIPITEFVIEYKVPAIIYFINICMGVLFN